MIPTPEEARQERGECPALSKARGEVADLLKSTYPDYANRWLYYTKGMPSQAVTALVKELEAVGWTVTRDRGSYRNDPFLSIRNADDD